MSVERSKKKVDSRIRALIEQNVACGHRSLVVIIGDKGREQIVNLHYILSKAQVAKRPTVLWCFKRELELSSHRKKRLKQLKKLKQLGSLTSESIEDDPFELFLTSTNINYVYYHESERILGNTFGMCVLQDFEALTPNLLARTMETVQGGGMVVLLLKTLTSLRQLCTMVMDVHARYRTESSDDPVARFNERFLLSLRDCATCLVVDDQLNVLPLSPFKEHPLEALMKDKLDRARKLEDYLEGHKDENKAMDKLRRCAKTVDQARIVGDLAAFLGSERVPRATASVTAARGRGKSATLGLALALAVSGGYANVFVTAPSADNVKTLFEFLFRGLDALGYMEHIDYDIISAASGSATLNSLSPTNPTTSLSEITAKQSLIVSRVNVYKNQHRQTILFIAPHEHHLLGQAELLFIDEAAAIPLPIVQQLLRGPHVAILSSTVNGYEGTGRSLSLKLLASLKTGNQLGRTLRELRLEEPIRYAPGDPVERWLNSLLCLDVTGQKTLQGCPRPEECNLYVVNRDTLFSYHKASEAFLQRMMALFVASHYKNTPNDLQLMSDAPGHLLFVLLPPVDEGSASSLPDILAVVQVALEGRISRQSVLNSFARGKKAAGDLIPWTLSQQFLDDDFASLSGARIVRIAVHPDYQGLGYGSHALRTLELFFQGSLVQPGAEEYREAVRHHRDMTHMVHDDDDDDTTHIDKQHHHSGDDGQNDPRPRINLKPLLMRVQQVDPGEHLQVHWLGSSFGLTPRLLKFWRQLQYQPVYLRQSANDVTGEHTMIVLKAVRREAQRVRCVNDHWLTQFHGDFCRRLVSLLPLASFKDLSTSLALSILSPVAPSHPDSHHGQNQNHSQNQSQSHDPSQSHHPEKMDPFDLKRLEAYGNNVVEHGMIADLLPGVARAFFGGRLPVSLSPVQQAILLALGLQHRDVDAIGDELRLPASQVLAMLCKSIKKLAHHYTQQRLHEIDRQGETESRQRKKIELVMEEEGEKGELENRANQVVVEELRIDPETKALQRQMIDSLRDLEQYAISGGEEEEEEHDGATNAGHEKQWQQELARKHHHLDKVVVSIKSKRKRQK